MAQDKRTKAQLLQELESSSLKNKGLSEALTALERHTDNQAAEKEALRNSNLQYLDAWGKAANDHEVTAERLISLSEKLNRIPSVIRWFWGAV